MGKLASYLLSVPVFLFIGVLFLLPVGLLVWSSFFHVEGPHAGSFTLDVYIKFFDDPYNISMVWRTAKLSAITTLVSLVLAFPVALHLRQMGPRMRSLITLMLISPLLTSVVVRTLSWVILLGPKGVINSALLSLNLSPVSLIYNDWGVVIGLTHVFFGYMALSLMTTISKIDDNLLLAASNLGASRWVILKEIIFPMSLPGILAGCVLVFGMSASTYATPALLGGTSSKLMATEIYDLTVNYLEFREAAAVALLLFIGVATISFLFNRWLEHGRGKVVFQ